MTKNKIGPFSDNPIMIGYDNRLFNFDNNLGHVFPEDKIIDQQKFISLNKKISALKNSKNKFLILNLGDSSTSGWNSDNVFKGCSNPQAALFSYKTYSDFLDDSGNDVINAGVPGYTTYQAKKYLEIILKRLAKNKIYVDYVTTYLGNNDCTFNSLEDKTRIDYKIASSKKILMRVAEKDFVDNYMDIIKITKSYGANLVILSPASNFKWQPGLRSEKYPKEFLTQINNVNHPEIKELFLQSKKDYQLRNYKQSLENDLLLPRIKQKYKFLLSNIASQNNIIFVDTQTFIKAKTDFIDYCHPNEKSNEKITTKLSSILKVKNKAYSKENVEQFLPADTYTLY